MPPCSGRPGTGVIEIIFSIPNSVTSIGGWTFYDCSSLTSVEIPASATNIGSSVFNGELQTDIYVQWTSPAGLVFDNVFLNVHKITLHVPIGCTRNYETRSPWNNFKEIVEYVPGGNEGKEKCATPKVEMEDGELVFGCETPGAKYYYTLDSADVAVLTNCETGRVALNAEYVVKVYAYAEGCDNSETVTKTFPMGNSEKIVEISYYIYDDSRSDIKMESGEVMVLQVRDGVIYIENAPIGDVLAVYAADGKAVNAVVVDGYETAVELPRNAIYIIKVGGKTFKVGL